MSNQSSATERYAEPPASPGRVQLGLVDYSVRLWRAKAMMAAVFAGLAGAGAFAAWQMPTEYTSTSRLMATLDDAYVFRPLAGGDAAGIALEANQVIQAELELLRSPVILESVLGDLGLARLYPDLAEDRAKDLAQGRLPREQVERLYREDALETLARDFDVSSAPERPVIFTSFTHADPDVAAGTLDLLIDTYLAYRTSLFSEGAGEEFEAQSQVFQAELAQADAAIRSFMVEHELVDVPLEQAAVQRLIETTRAELFRTRAQQRALASQRISLKSDLDRTPREVDLFVEDTSGQTLVELELQREDLLARYTPSSEPVQVINARIAQVESFLERQQGASGTVRRGINPVYSDLSTDFAILEAEAEALAGEAGALDAQLAELTARSDQLAVLAPQWRDLLRARDLAETNVVEYSSRAIEERSRRDLVQRRADNIRVLEPARVPAEGRSLRLPILAGGIFFAGFSALMAGLLHAATRQGFTTPTSLTRTMGVPVLATLGPGRI
ncbi:MAG: hypothetical protein AAGH87_06425 [Pseudomonadota bacterium]